MTRSRDTADTQDNNGGAVPPFVAGKNVLINGGFDFFQRGSFSQSSAGYALDRWRVDTGGTLTITQQTTGAPVGSRYYTRVAFGATTYSDFMQLIETSQVAPLWGNTATLQIKLRRNASLTTDLSVIVQKSATIDAGAGATWTTIAASSATNAQLPTGTGPSNWYQVQYPVVVPNDGTANSLRVLVAVVAGQPSGAYWEAAQAQLEVGSVATPFSRAGGTLQGELAACERYYQIVTGQMLSGINANVIGGSINFRTPMRTGPSVALSAAMNLRDAAADYAQTSANVSIVASRANERGAQIEMANFPGTITANRPYFTNVTLSQIQFSAEL